MCFLDFLAIGSNDCLIFSPLLKYGECYILIRHKFLLEFPLRAYVLSAQLGAEED